MKGFSTVHVLPRCVADYIPWRDAQGKSFVSIVAKLTFSFVPGETCRVAAPLPLYGADRHRDRSPVRELEAASDWAPFLPHPEVLVVGHAYVPGGRSAPALTAQVSLGAGDTLFTKALTLYGDRSDAGSRISPFSRAPLSWERAARGDTNPVGMLGEPSIVDLRRPTEPAGFGPIAALWKERRQKLGSVPRSLLDAEPFDMPKDFDATFFQAAPRDQWLKRLIGDEWLALDGLHPALPRLVTRLPGVRVAARLEGQRGGRSFVLKPDRLVLDTDAQTASLTYRGVEPCDLDALASHRLFVGCLDPGHPVVWPDASDPRSICLREFGRSVGSKVPVSDSTVEITSVTSTYEIPGSAAAKPPLEADDDEGASTLVANIPPQIAALPFAGATKPEVPDAPPEDSGSPGTAVFDAAKLLGMVDAFPFARSGDASPPSSEPASSAPSTKPAFPPAHDAPVHPFTRAPNIPPPAAAPPAPPPPLVTPSTFVAPAIVAPAIVAPAPVPQPIAPPARVGLPELTLPTGKGAIGFKPGDAPQFVDEPTFDPSAAAEAAWPFPAASHTPVEGEPSAAGLPFSGSAASTGSDPSAGLPFSPPPAFPAPPPPFAAPPKTDDAPEVIEPRGDSVPTLAEGPLLIATIPWQIQPPNDALVVVVKASFDLVPDEPATFRDEPELPLGDMFAGEDPESPLVFASDFAIMKPQCDVLFYGSAYAPNGKSTAMQVTLRVKGATGKVDRSLAVFGDRTWQRALVAVAPSPPKDFTSLPIDWLHAFGGPEHAQNPHGVGYRARPDKDGVLRLPNFEHAVQRIKSPDDTPQSSSFAPIHPQWKARWGLLGTYDKLWFIERWPYFPKDFDYTFFQAAPVGQRLERAIGDETYELIGLTPDRPRVSGKLPGQRVRVFAKKKTEGKTVKKESFVEVPVKLDTISFFGDQNRVDLVWRGNLEVTDDDAPEIERFFAFSEPTEGPATSLDDVRLRYLAALLPKDEPEPIVDEETMDDSSLEEAAPETDDGSADEAGRKIDEFIAAKEKEIEESMRAQGIEPDGSAAMPPPMDPKAMAEVLRAAGTDEEDVKELLEALEGAAKGDDEPPPLPDVDLRELVKARVAAGESLEALDLRAADLRDLDLSKQNLARCDLSDAKLDRVLLDGANLDEANLQRAIFDDGSCKGASFLDADLTQASLERTNFAGAILDAARLDEAHGDKVVFDGASAKSTSFFEARLPRARFTKATLEEADFSSAEIDEAIFDGATLAKVKLYDARGARASFVGCEMTNTRAESASFVKASFEGAFIDDSVFESADLTTATFQGASLVSTSFVRATCFKTNFNEADMSTARLRKARMNGATFLKTNLFEATLERANFELADLRGANLHAAVIWRTHLKHARLEGAIVTASALGRRNGE